MKTNLAQFVKNSRDFGPSDIPLVIERIRTHLVMDRMEGAEFRDTIKALGYFSLNDFSEEIGLPLLTVESWAKFGMARDTAQLLRMMLDYRHRLKSAVKDFDFHTNVGLEDFFADYKLL
jgi:hypothetical protein